MRSSDPLWAALERAPRPALADLFAADPGRLARLSVEEAASCSISPRPISTPACSKASPRSPRRSDLAGAREALFAGRIVNPTEGRAAEHSAERGQGAPESVARAAAFHARMRALIDAIEAEAFGPIRHILHIGIGGSALGPDFLIDALGRGSDRYETAIVSNVDGAALEEAVGFRPADHPAGRSRPRPSPPPRRCSTPAP
jgi:glucose-6-phosphate isomerase